MARARERVVYTHWVRLVLNKLTNQKFGNLIRYARLLRLLLEADRMQIQDRKTTLSQFVKQLSEY